MLDKGSAEVRDAAVVGRLAQEVASLAHKKGTRGVLLQRAMSTHCAERPPLFARLL